MQVRLNKTVSTLVKKANHDQELRKHMFPNNPVVSAADIVNAITYQFLTKWEEKKRAGN